MSDGPGTEPASSRSTAFHHFQKLPVEIRCLIWTHAFPPLDQEPRIMLYKRGLWRKKHLTAADEAYNPDGSHECVMLDYRMNKQKSIEVDLVDVNREARQVTLLWARKLGLELSYLPETKRLAFRKPFDPETDVLCVANDGWFDFSEGSEFLHGEPDIREPGILIFPYITRLMAADTLFEKAIVEIHTVLSRFHTLTTFYVLLTRPWYELKGMIIEPRLPDLDPLEGRTLTWHLEDQEFRLHGSAESGCLLGMFVILEVVADRLKAKFIKSRKQKFEMATILPYRLLPCPPGT
ncbi:unnamed protein product [Clonostachys solani]|uniref:2EXR domain-containing protein n=1 Tax=Clonostachys solani TaxID=160281 RepID=A0A9N9W5V9_9HYPO|nr:unnamed protein product [Clonostachys solani]